MESKEVDRMSPKSALAYNFFDFDIGFQKFPSTSHDVLADDKLTKQFLSRDNSRGEFEVNQEHGGIYWYLYKTLRSNSLYNDGQDVHLSRWICPGFYFTMIAWFLLVVVSPLALLASGTYFYQTGAVSILLTSIGLVTPLLYLGGKLRKNWGHGDFAGEYWPYVGAGFSFFAISFFMAFFYMSFGKFISFWIFLGCTIFLAPYCILKKTFAFWKMQYLGKLLSAVFLASVAQELWYRSMFWEAVREMSIAMMYWLMEYANILSIIAGAIAVFIAFIILVDRRASLAETSIKKIIETKELTNTDDYAVTKNILFGFGVVYASIVLCLVSLVSSNPSGITLLSFVLVAMLYKLSTHLQEHFNVEAQFATAVTLRSIPVEKACVSALTKNPFWFYTKTTEPKEEMIKMLWRHTSSSGELQECLLLITSEEDYQRTINFFSSNLFIELKSRYHLYGGKGGNDFSTLGVMPLIIKGVSEEDLVKAIKTKKEALDKKKTWITVVSNYLDMFFLGCTRIFKILVTPFVFIGKTWNDVRKVIKTFNEECPASPPRERGVFQ